MSYTVKKSNNRVTLSGEGKLQMHRVDGNSKNAIYQVNLQIRSISLNPFRRQYDLHFFPDETSGFTFDFDPQLEMSLIGSEAWKKVSELIGNSCGYDEAAARIKQEKYEFCPELREAIPTVELILCPPAPHLSTEGWNVKFGLAPTLDPNKCVIGRDLLDFGFVTVHPGYCSFFWGSDAIEFLCRKLTRSR